MLVAIFSLGDTCLRHYASVLVSFDHHRMPNSFMLLCGIVVGILVILCHCFGESIVQEALRVPSCSPLPFQ